MDEICFVRLVPLVWQQLGKIWELFLSAFNQSSEHHDSLEEKDESEELEELDMYLQKEVRLVPLSSCFT